jgi:hypothetical protein
VYDFPRSHDYADRELSASTSKWHESNGFLVTSDPQIWRSSGSVSCTVSQGSNLACALSALSAWKILPGRYSQERYTEGSGTTMPRKSSRALRDTMNLYIFKIRSNSGWRLQRHQRVLSASPQVMSTSSRGRITTGARIHMMKATSAARLLDSLMYTFCHAHYQLDDLHSWSKIP